MARAAGEGERENLEAIRSVVFKESETMDDVRFQKISGYDFNRGIDFISLLDSMVSTGFQASNLGDAIEVVNQMLDWGLPHVKPTEDCTEEELDPAFRESVRCKIFLGFTSNLVSSGVRDIIRFLVEHRMVASSGRDDISHRSIMSIFRRKKKFISRLSVQTTTTITTMTFILISSLQTVRQTSACAYQSSELSDTMPFYLFQPHIGHKEHSYHHPPPYQIDPLILIEHSGVETLTPHTFIEPEGDT